MKILFIVPQLKSMYGDSGIKSCHPHVGIAYLSSWLKMNKIEVELFDDGIELSNEKLIEKIKNSDADLIGITMFSYCYQIGYDLINLIKKTTKTPLVVGGAHISATKKQILEETEADFAIKHEGEKTLLELIQYTSTGRNDFENIDGLIWRNNYKEIIENKDRKLLSSKELDELPLPDYESFVLEKYLCYETKTLPIITSRGCPYGCNYCSVKLSMGRSFRYRSAINVYKELKHWHDRGWVNFDINDDCFTFDMKRAGEICDLIIINNLKIKFSLYNGIRVDRVDQRLLSKLKEAGCVFLTFGCESGNENILKQIKKGITLSQVRQASVWAHSLGIKHSVNFIIGHTKETYKMAMDSLRFAKSLPCEFVNFYNLVPYPNTEAYKWAEEHGKFLVDKNNYLKYISYRENTPIFETSEFTKEERMKITKEGFDLYEMKILQFRLGKVIGTISYYLTRMPLLHDIGLSILRFKVGWKLFVLLSSKSRR